MAMRDELELYGDPSAAERFRRWRRTGRILILAIVIAALLGVMGDGPLSRADAYGGYVKVRYPRFTRVSEAEEITVVMEAPVTRGGSCTFWLDDNYLRRFKVESITPVPAPAVLTGSHVTYTFRCAPGEEARVRLRLRSKAAAAGPLVGEIGVAEGGYAQMRQYVWP